MTLQPETQPIKVLLYTGNIAAASCLAALLTSQDMAVTTACCIQDLHDAIKLAKLDVATTHTAGVEITRRVTSLPVINFDAFVFTVPAGRNDKVEKRQLDSSAFLRRLFDVARPRSILRAEGSEV